MRNKLLHILLLLITIRVQGQSELAAEHYYYITKTEIPAMVPILRYSTPQKWYGEARYNYEDFHTLSVYAGKTFSKEGKLGVNATPMIGGLLGTMNGGSVAINVDSEFDELFFSSQSQYSFSLEQKLNRYFFTWSELGYQFVPWCYAGLALQQTTMRSQQAQWETGYMLGLCFKSWTIPLYVFSVSKEERYFIVGINWEWNNQDKRISKVDL